MKLTSNSLTPRSVAGAAVLMLAVGAALPLVLRLIGGSVEMFVWAFVVVVLVLGLVVIRRIDRRLGSLTEVAEAIERGQVAPPTHDLDEGSIGDLSRAIRKMADRVHERINHDILTGLPNRRFFDALLEPAIREADERRRVLGVVLLDLDTFKDVNDGFGHEFGDDLLKQVAVRLVDSVRDTDAVARFGGDEFAVVVAGADSADAVMGSARRLVQAFREPFRVDGHELTVTASAGVGVYPKDGSTPLELVRSADAALYRAKNGGRNRLQICDDVMGDWVRLRSEVGEDLRLAIERGEIGLHYQPHVSLADGRILGFEALARWNHPERGPLPPDMFISVAEETGQIPALGAELLLEGCSQNARWHRQGVRRLPISMNVSIRQLQAGNLVAIVEEALRESALPAKYLHLELSDNQAIRHMEKVLDCVSSLGRAGVRFAMDDFGTGYSSMRHLLRYPLCTLKIDQSLIAGVPEDKDSVTIVEATIGLAKGLGLDVVAEGVETRAQLEFLRGAGCPAAQGFLLSRPMPADSFTFLLKRGYVDLEEPGGVPLKAGA